LAVLITWLRQSIVSGVVSLLVRHDIYLYLYLLMTG